MTIILNQIYTSKDFHNLPQLPRADLFLEAMAILGVGPVMGVGVIWLMDWAMSFQFIVCKFAHSL